MKLSDFLKIHGDCEVNEEMVKKSIIERKGRWKPEIGEEYWCISDDVYTHCKTWAPFRLHQRRYDLGNCFKTQKEAEFAREKHKVLVELQDYADLYNEREIDWRDLESDIEKYYLTYDYNGEEIVIEETYSCYNGGNSVYFTSIETAKKAIETIGEDRIKKYLFGVK